MQKPVNLLVKQLDEAQNNANPHEYTALTHGRLLYAHHSETHQSIIGGGGLIFTYSRSQTIKTIDFKIN